MQTPATSQARQGAPGPSRLSPLLSVGAAASVPGAPATLDPYTAFVEGHRDRPGPPTTLFLESLGQGGSQIDPPEKSPNIEHFSVGRRRYLLSFSRWDVPIPGVGEESFRSPWLLEAEFRPGPRSPPASQKGPSLSENSAPCMCSKGVGPDNL